MKISGGWTWNGHKYSIEEKSLFPGLLPLRIYFLAKNGLAELSYEPIKIKLPLNSAFLIRRDYNAIQGWKGDFQKVSEWEDFQALLCDQYCEHMILGNAEPQNIYKTSWGPGPTIPMTHWVAIHAIAKEYPSFVLKSN